MNFKTTLLLAIVLLVLAAAYFMSQREGGPTATKTSAAGKLVSITNADVTKISITPPEGQATVLERSGGEWRITAPVSAKAEKFAVEDLLTSVTSLGTRGETLVEEKDRAALGLDKPTRVALTAKDGKTVDLSFGSRSAVGDSTYVLTSTSGKAQIVSADVLEKIEDPLKKVRDMRLTDLSSADVKQIVVQRPEGTLKMEKRGETWTMTQPQQIPLETFEVSDILSGVTNLRAAEFVAEDPAAAAKYGLTQPRYVVQLSTAAPATQPSTTGPAFTEIRLGSYDDIRKQNVYAMAGQTGPIAKVSATVIGQLTKKPLELRDRKVLEIDPAIVQSVAIATDLPATTQPTTREASRASTKVIRNQATALQGPPAPATAQGATGPATTVPATQESAAWVLENRKPANEEKVKDLLESLKTVRTTKYLESLPEGTVNARYQVTITTVAAGGSTAAAELLILDRGANESPVGQYKGLTFELERELLSKLKLD